MPPKPRLKLYSLFEALGSLILMGAFIVLGSLKYWLSDVVG